MISGYEAFVQLDSYSHPEQRNDCRFNCHHPIINFAAHHNYHRQSSAGDTIPTPGDNNHSLASDRTASRPAMAKSGGGETRSRGPQIRLIDLSSEKSVDSGKKSRRPVHQSSHPTDFSSKKRTRYNFTPAQTRALEQSFDLVTHYPDFTAMDEMADKLSLPVERIQVWFQNRRAKFRRNSAAGVRRPAS